jgi:hypothetical protein
MDSRCRFVQDMLCVRHYCVKLRDHCGVRNSLGRLGAGGARRRGPERAKSYNERARARPYPLLARIAGACRISRSPAPPRSRMGSHSGRFRDLEPSEAPIVGFRSVAGVGSRPAGCARAAPGLLRASVATPEQAKSYNERARARPYPLLARIAGAHGISRSPAPSRSRIGSHSGRFRDGELSEAPIVGFRSVAGVGSRPAEAPRPPPASSATPWPRRSGRNHNNERARARPYPSLARIAGACGISRSPAPSRSRIGSHSGRFRDLEPSGAPIVGFRSCPFSCCALLCCAVRTRQPRRAAPRRRTRPAAPPPAAGSVPDA